MENTNEGEVVELQEAVETLEEATEEVQDTTDWKAKYEEAQGKLKRAETKLEKTKIEKTVEKRVEERTKTGELDDAVLDFFELKGYGSEEETEVFHNIMKRTGMSHREVIKDEYALAKVKSIRDANAVKEATPSGTRRPTNTMNDIDYLYAKFEQTGELPSDYEMKTKVLDRKVAKENTNKPRWKK